MNAQAHQFGASNGLVLGCTPTVTCKPPQHAVIARSQIGHPVLVDSTYAASVLASTPTRRDPRRPTTRLVSIDRKQLAGLLDGKLDGLDLGRAITSIKREQKAHGHPCSHTDGQPKTNFRAGYSSGARVGLRLYGMTQSRVWAISP